MSDLLGVVPENTDQTFNVQYKFEGIPLELRALLEPLTGYTPGAYRSQLAGFKMNRKYISARVFEQLNVNDPSALANAVAQLNALGFNAVAVGRDEIDDNDGQPPVDVIQNSWCLDLEPGNGYRRRPMGPWRRR